MASFKNIRGGMGYMPIGTPATSEHPLDLETDGVGWTFQAREADAITHIGFRYGVRTGTPPTYVVTLEGVSATTGFPDAADVGGGSPTATTFTPPADTTWNSTFQWIALTNAYTPTRGQLLAATIRWSVGTVSGSHNGTFTSHITNLGTNAFYAFPTSQRLTAGTWAKQGATQVFGVRTASTRYGLPIEGLYNTRSASTVGHRQALKFTLPAGSGDTFKIKGMRLAGSVAGATGKNPVMGLWSASSMLQDYAFDTEWGLSAATSYITWEFLFDESTLATLSFGTAYYLGLEVADATNGGVIINGLQLDAADDLDAFAGGTECHLATWNGSAWTDDQTVRPFVEWIFDDITEPAGGSGGGLKLAGTGGLAG